MSASWRARICGIPTGPATPLTRWATRCPGHRSIRRSIPTSHGSREGRPMAVSYASYLKLDELLALQQPRSPGPEHDEMLFIVIHQVYELWFKEMLHELGYLEQLLRDNDTPRALHTLKRILTVLKVMVAQIDVLDTKNPAAVARYAEGSEGRRRLEARYREPTLWDAFLAYLARNQYPVPAALRDRDVRRPPEPSREMQQVLITVYRTNPAVASVCERLVDLDEGIMEWRYRHVKMVQRTIGTKPGTGGSAGAEYLETTLNKPAFPDLWAIRTEL